MRKLLVSVVIVFGLGMMGLITYSYLYLGKSGELSVRGESTVNISKLILNFSQGSFLDKRAKVRADVAAPLLGYLAPDFTLKDLNGRPVKLSGLRGKPVLLNFWATWCPPCRKEMPDLQKFHELYGDKITLLGIDFGESKSDVLAFLREFGITYANLLDRDGRAFVRYRLTGIPTSYWIDSKGIIRGIWEGAMSLETMVEGFKKSTNALEEGR